MKDKKAKASSKRAFTAREVAVLVEELRADFRSIGEDVKSLRERIEDVRENQAETLKKITIIELRLARIESDFAKRLATLEASHK